MIRISKKKKIFLFIFDKFGPKKNEEGRFKLVTFALVGMMLADCSTPWGCKNVYILHIDWLKYNCNLPGLVPG